MSIDAAICSCILDYDNPYAALEEIKSIYKMQDTRALSITYTAIKELRFGSKDTVSSFINNLLLLKKDIKDLKGTYTED